MASIKLRAGRTTPLTIAEVDDNFNNLNNDKLETTLFTGTQILNRIKEVDGTGSGLDADVLDGLAPTTLATGNTIVARDSSGNFSAVTINSNIVGNVTGNVIGNVTGNLTGSVTGNVTGTATNSTQLGGIAAASYALLASPSLTGTPTAPTAATGTNTTQLATTAFVRTAVNAATSALGTLSTQNSNAVTITGGAITNTTINGNTVGSNSTGNKTVSTALPTGGANGDIWYQY